MSGGGEDISRQIDRLLEKYNRADSPGAAVLVQLHGENVYQKCAGMASLEHQIPITPEISFDLASVSKHLTAFSVLYLEQQGKLDLNDDIRQYLPELPDFGKTVTIENLLHQTSGLWEFWTTLNRYSGFMSRDYITLKDVLILLRGQRELIFPPGSRYAYTNTNYSLLAEIVSRVTGVSFGRWTEENVFRPLGMKDTHFQEDCRIPIMRKASAYRMGNGRLVLARPSNVEIPGSAHAFTTLSDMAKWIGNFRTKRLGGEAVFSKMFKKGTLNSGEEMSYAGGLIVTNHNGKEIVEHSGQTGGYKTMLIYCPEKELGIVVLANERSINAHRLSHRILALYLGEERETESGQSRENEKPFIELDGSVLRKLTGGYRLEDSGLPAGFYIDGGYLVGHILGVGKEYLFPVSETEFFDYGRSLKITFTINVSGSVEAVSIFMRGRTSMASRIVNDRESSLEKFTGTYYCAALGSVCEIREETNGLILSHRRYGDITLFSIGAGQYVGGWGFLSFHHDPDGAVDGFILEDELFGYKTLSFSRVPDTLSMIR
jgi:CubicO group peptidase (beta-lactamase class C family)